MSPTDDDTFLSRPPKLSPKVAVIVGGACIPLGFFVKGTIGGALVGGGIAAVLMGIWDFARLRYVAWRRSRAASNSGPGEEHRA